MSNKRGPWICEVEQAPDGEYFIQLTDEMLEGSGFAIGDALDWKDNKDGSWTLTKKEPEEDKVWVMVDALMTYRMRYCVQAPASNPEYALDDVTMQTTKEFSQEALPEQICSWRVVSQEEALAMCDKDNDYAKSWTDEHKIKTFFTKEGDIRDY
jgi:hypothetical protein